MVTGNGMMAQAFSSLANDESVMVFASGVSNSKETNPAAFQRELDLLSSCDKNTKLIYFSTCSVYDTSLQDSMYVKHKLAVENYISLHFLHYLIFRLPIVVGVTNNQATLFNYFKNSISRGERVKIQESATRYLIDVSDVVSVVNIINASTGDNNIINIAFNNQESVLGIANAISQVVGVSLCADLIPGGSNYTIPNETLFDFLSESDYIIPDDYNNIVISKYANSSSR